ncbi:MAG: hypothetical protein KDB22_06655 [Planctomycetales bacterium]|nr:hypothetical protein [Planctomycetales bacterium]
MKPTVFAVSCLLVLGCSLTSEAAIVTFQGSLTSGNGSLLGAVPPTRDFSVTLDFTETSPGFATINGGSFNVNPTVLTIDGGDIILVDNNSNDQALFSFQSSGPAGSFSVSFIGDAILNNRVTAENLRELIEQSSPSTLSADFGGSGSYTGSVISAVPEPGFFPAALGLAWLASRRRRRIAV